MWEEKTICATLLGHATQEVHHLESLRRIGAVERLVKEKHLRFVDDGGGDLDALLHAFRVAADAPVLGRLHVDGADGAARGPGGVAEAVQLRAHEHELIAGEEWVDGFLLRYEADVGVHLVVPPCGSTGDPNGAFGRAEEASGHVEDSALAGTIGAEQPGDAGPE